MDDRLAEQLDAWWATLTDSEKNDLMDDPGGALSAAGVGELPPEAYAMSRIGDGPWITHLRSEAERYVYRRATRREVEAELARARAGERRHVQRLSRLAERSCPRHKRHREQLVDLQG